MKSAFLEGRLVEVRLQGLSCPNSSQPGRATIMPPSLALAESACLRGQHAHSWANDGMVLRESARTTQAAATEKVTSRWQ